MRLGREELQNILDRAFDSYLESLPENGLHERIRYALSGKGKRIRPTLVLMGHLLFDEDPEAALPAALAVEVFHNFTLVHDDIMDNAPLRRGRATVHSKWDSNGAILSGDAMLIEAYSLLNRLDTPQRVRVFETFNKTALEVCLGQQYDMDFEVREDVTESEYLEMIRLKTAVLLGGSLKIGALIAGASDRDAEELYAFGVEAGIAFQLQDDLLDAFGNPKTFGKQVGGDILSNKKTYLYIRALEKASAARKKELRRHFSQNVKKAEEAAKVKSVVCLFRSLGIDEDTRKLSDAHFKAALSHLTRVSAGPFQKRHLRDFIEDLSKRDK